MFSGEYDAPDNTSELPSDGASKNLKGLTITVCGHVTTGRSLSRFLIPKMHFENSTLKANSLVDKTFRVYPYFDLLLETSEPRLFSHLAQEG